MQIPSIGTEARHILERQYFFDRKDAKAFPFCSQNRNALSYCLFGAKKKS